MVTLEEAFMWWVRHFCLKWAAETEIRKIVDERKNFYIYQSSDWFRKISTVPPLFDLSRCQCGVTIDKPYMEDQVSHLQKMGIPSSSVVRSSPRIPITEKDKVSTCVIGEILRLNARGRNTNTNYVDSDTESEQNSTPKYMISVGETLGQRSGIVTVVVGGVHLPMSLLTQPPFTWSRVPETTLPPSYPGRGKV